MIKKQASQETQKKFKAWYITATNEKEFQLGLEPASRNEGKNCAYFKTMVKKPKSYGTISQNCSAEQYLGKRLRMTAWVKSDLTEGKGQLWLRVNSESWPHNSRLLGVLDNMWDRPIKGTTDWQQYSLVVRVPDNSRTISFGLMHIGVGKLWLDEFAFESVGDDVPLTGNSHTPQNLDFQDTED